MKTLVSLIGVVLLSNLCMGGIIHVPGDSATIQAGIDGANSGDTVLVAGGTYYENPIINKSIYLRGTSPNNTIINGSGTGDVILITSNAVHIKMLTVTNSGDFTPMTPEYEAWDAGIKIVEADSCVIEYCNVSENNAAGLALALSEHNTIAKCVFSSNVVGIMFYEIFQGPKDDNLMNRILNNHLTDNSKGIWFSHTEYIYHHSTAIRCNYVYDNVYGLYAIMSQENEVTYNNFTSNADYGIFHYVCSGGGDENMFHHNSFLYNNGGSVQAHDFSDEWYFDYWFSPSEAEGNYWSDYTGNDDDSNGIGDTPYWIEGWDNADWFPLMQSEDSDADELIDSVDNCPDCFNPAQGDIDFDFVGDSCDNCILVWNPDQADSNGDGFGDVCESSCGDVALSGLVDIDDVVFLVNYIFSGGPTPIPPESGDVDCSGGVDIDDVVYLVMYIFASGPEPCADCP